MKRRRVILRQLRAVTPREGRTPSDMLIWLPSSSLENVSVSSLSCGPPTLASSSSPPAPQNNTLLFFLIDMSRIETAQGAEEWDHMGFVSVCEQNSAEHVVFVSVT